MLLILDDLLKCLGPCHTLALSTAVQWEYSIGPDYPTEAQLQNDRLHCQGVIVSYAASRSSSRGVFRFTTYGGIGGVCTLVAEDVRRKLAGCVGCRVGEFDIQCSSTAYPNKSSNRRVPVAAITFAIRC